MADENDNQNSDDQDSQNQGYINIFGDWIEDKTMLALSSYAVNISAAKEAITVATGATLFHGWSPMAFKFESIGQYNDINLYQTSFTEDEKEVTLQEAFASLVSREKWIAKVEEHTEHAHGAIEHSEGAGESEEASEERTKLRAISSKMGGMSDRITEAKESIIETVQSDKAEHNESIMTALEEIESELTSKLESLTTVATKLSEKQSYIANNIAELNEDGDVVDSSILNSTM